MAVKTKAPFGAGGIVLPDYVGVRIPDRLYTILDGKSKCWNTW